MGTLGGKCDWSVKLALGNLVAHSLMALAERGTSSTYRELCGVFSFLQSIVAEIRGRVFQLFVDNFGVTHIVSKGSSVVICQQKAVEIFLFCREHDVQLEVYWIPRTENEIADYLAEIEDTSDWKLNDASREELESRLGWGARRVRGALVPFRHTLDRCATHLNCVVPRFNSAWWCPNTLGVDCFRQPVVSWLTERNRRRRGKFASHERIGATQQYPSALCLRPGASCMHLTRR